MTRKSSSVTIREVARQAGVSVATVSRYINRNATVSEEVSKRIEQVMSDLHYVPHAVARNLATRKTRTIGLILREMHNEFFAPLFSGIESIVGKNSYNLLVSTSRPNMQSGYMLPVWLQNTDGLLVFVDSLDDKHLMQLHAMGAPVVLIHRTPPASLPFPCVTVENKAASRKLIKHLIEVHGKRRIIFMRGPSDQEDSHWREIGYREALEEHEIPYDPKLILPGEFDSRIARKSLQNYLSQGDSDFEAVFAADDDSAVGVLEALREAGKRVPEDIAVVGFDDQRISSFLRPPLTTVRAPTYEVGRTAAQQLFNLLHDRPAEPMTLLPTEIVLRSSCGCEVEQPLEGGEI